LLEPYRHWLRFYARPQRLPTRSCGSASA
jgi:hypothetical protein